nr:hypothetical protein [uncultured Cupriavidus sp.]
MSDHPRFTINRSVVILMPEQPFLDWIKAVDPEPVPSLSLDRVRDDASVFLLPGEVAESDEDALRWVEKRWRYFFEFLLGEWFDISLWPEKLTLAMFREWFTPRLHSMVWDMAPEAPIEHEDWDEGDDDEESPTLLH